MPRLPGTRLRRRRTRRRVTPWRPRQSRSNGTALRLWRRRQKLPQRTAPPGSFEDLQGQKNPVAVGDRVRLDLSTDPASLEEVLPRRNYLGRVASSHDPREQVLVSNVDQLFVIGSLRSPGFSSNRTDRILAACSWHQIPAVLVFNKADLDKKGTFADRYLSTYRDVPDLRVLVTSAKTGEGVEEMCALLKDRVSVFYGPSGAGSRPC